MFNKLPRFFHASKGGIGMLAYVAALQQVSDQAVLPVNAIVFGWL